MTPTTDASIFLDEAIASVPRREHKEIEHIVVHDGSPELLEVYSRRYPWLRVMRGPSSGATSAISCAIIQSSGDFIFLLNSDDRMVEGSIRAWVEAVRTQPEREIWTGGTRIFESDTGRTVREIHSGPYTDLTLENILDDLPLMTARFIRRSTYERVGVPDDAYSTCSDRELAIRMSLTGIRDGRLGVVVSELRMHDGSYSIRNSKGSTPVYFREHLTIARKEMGNQNLSKKHRTMFREWHARETARKLYYEVKNFQVRVAADTVREAFLEDLLWPWRARSILRARRLRRRASG